MTVSGPITFDGRVAVVGAGGGLGRAYALELARRGAQVVVNDVRGAEAIVDEIRAGGGEALATHHSVSTEAAGQIIIDEGLDAFGSVDVLINNAGIVRDRSLAKLSAAELEAVLDVHLRGSFHVTQPAFRAMQERGYGRIFVRDLRVGAVRELSMPLLPGSSSLPPRMPPPPDAHTRPRSRSTPGQPRRTLTGSHGPDYPHPFLVTTWGAGSLAHERAENPSAAGLYGGSGV